MKYQFIDLGAGWFLYEDEMDRCSIVCDALATEPDHFFGPAAWQGQAGPLSGKTILEVHSVVCGDWQQSGPQEWTWCSEDGREYEEPPASWPRHVKVRDDSVSSVLRGVISLTFASPEELDTWLRTLTRSLPEHALPCATKAERMELSSSMHAAFHNTSH